MISMVPSHLIVYESIWNLRFLLSGPTDLHTLLEPRLIMALPHLYCSLLENSFLSSMLEINPVNTHANTLCRVIEYSPYTTEVLFPIKRTNWPIRM